MRPLHSWLIAICKARQQRKRTALQAHMTFSTATGVWYACRECGMCCHQYLPRPTTLPGHPRFMELSRSGTEDAHCRGARQPIQHAHQYTLPWQASQTLLAVPTARGAPVCLIRVSLVFLRTELQVAQAQHIHAYTCAAFHAVPQETFSYRCAS